METGVRFCHEDPETEPRKVRSDQRLFMDVTNFLSGFQAEATRLFKRVPHKRSPFFPTEWFMRPCALALTIVHKQEPGRIVISALVTCLVMNLDEEVLHCMLETSVDPVLKWFW